MKKRIVIFMVLLGLWTSVHAQQALDFSRDPQHLTAATTGVDKSCVQLKEYGPCAIGQVPGVWISYYEPSLVVITRAHQGSWGTVSSGNLQFNEVHIYDFPLKDEEQMVYCPSLIDHNAGLRYASEHDRPLWTREKGHGVFGLEMIGTWGPLRPLTGFVVNYSPAVASALASLRAIVAGGVLSGHHTLTPIPFGVNQYIDRIQMVEPQRQMCMRPGTDVRFWPGGLKEGDRRDPAGNYTWIYWRFITCCKTVIPIPTR